MPMIFGRPILHKYANEDVSLGSWFIGLEVNHIDERNMCCGTPPGLSASSVLTAEQPSSYTSLTSPNCASTSLQTVSGKGKPAMYASRPLIGAAAAYASLSRG